MNSFISHFRAWIVAALLIGAAEIAIYSIARPGPFDRTNFLQFSFAHSETAQRLFVFDKIKAFADVNPTIVQSGDSSGFYGIEPSVVMDHLPPGNSYLNMSCCANLGFNGYYNILDFIAARNSAVRYLVLHITPYTMPIPEMWESDGAALWGAPEIKVFGDAVYEEFISIWRIFHLPSLAFRRQVTDRVYYMNGLLNRLDRPLLDNVNYSEFSRVFRKNLGWMPETDPRNGVSAAECDIAAPTFFSFRSLSRRTYLEEVLEAYSAMAKQRNVKLVVVFQPVACTLGTGAGSAKAREALDRFKQLNPEVAVPFPLIETWPSDMFSVPAHVRHEYTDRLGHRLGTAMAEILRRNGGR